MHIRPSAFLLTLLLAVLPGWLLAQDLVLVDRIVALVEDDVILLSELEDALDMIERQAEMAGDRLPPRSVIQEQLLERLILTRLEVLRAEETGIRVSDADVDQALRQVAVQNNLDLTSLRLALENDGVDFAEFRRSIREEILSSRLRQRVVNSMEEVSDTEIDIVLASDRLGGNEYLLSQIVISVPEAAGQEAIREAAERAMEVRERIANGLDFETAALTFSQGPNAMQGGEVGWRGINSLPPEIAEAVRSTALGGVTEVLRMPSGFVILHVGDQREPSQVIVREFRARHLMIQANELIGWEEAESRVRDLHEQLLAGASFADLAREHSMDENTANLGGLLNWFPAGAYGDSVQRIIDELEPGEISDPFRSADGWHIVQLEQVRDSDRTDEALRDQARDMLTRQKAEEEIDRFLRRLRDESFVEIRLEVE